MLNIEKYKDEILEKLDCNDLGYVISTIFYIYSREDNKATEKYAFEWLCEECKEPILTDKEREYLKAVCKPFRNHTVSIEKCMCSGNNYSYFIKLHVDWWTTMMPSFGENEMYKGMEADKEYTLEELGITYDD